MQSKRDWRLQGQEKCLKGVTLFFERYHMSRDDWDHDHCEFCSQKFSEEKEPDTVQDGYTTEDHYRWICKQCYEDFHELFEWKVGSPAKPK